jgi:hypothetical protein
MFLKEFLCYCNLLIPSKLNKAIFQIRDCPSFQRISKLYHTFISKDLQPTTKVQLLQLKVSQLALRFKKEVVIL